MIESDGWETVYCSPPIDGRRSAPHIETFDDNRDECIICKKFGIGPHRTHVQVFNLGDRFTG
jgi:hypothetical protein